MSDVMLFGVLKMPYELAMSTELSRRQFYGRVQELVARFEAEQPAQQQEQVCLEKKCWSPYECDDGCKNLAQPAQQQEPVAWVFQHEETGRTMCVDAQQVEWGFEKGNPRLKKIAPLYKSPPASKPLTDEQAETAFKAWHYKHGNNTQGIKWVDDLLRSCWKAAIEAAHAKGDV